MDWASSWVQRVLNSSLTEAVCALNIDNISFINFINTNMARCVIQVGEGCDLKTLPISGRSFAGREVQDSKATETVREPNENER